MTKNTKTEAFNAENFTIRHLSASPEGFQFKTRRAIGRTESIQNEDGLRLGDEDKARLARSVKGEMKFNNAAEVSDARKAWHEAQAQGKDGGEVSRLHEDYETIRKAYINKGKKIGFRAIELTNDNTLTADVQLVPFTVYNEFASPLNSPEVQELSSSGSVSMILRTADNRILLQHRAVSKPKLHEGGMKFGNASYADIPGASAAGMLDASLTEPDRKPGTPDNVTTETIKDSILSEAEEELGLKEEDMDGLRIVGVAQNKAKFLDEMLFLADTKLTVEQIKEASREAKRNKNLGSIDFEEKFIDIDGSPKAIETLLTEVRCPIAPTHTAAFVAAGYSLVLREKGTEAAEEWKSRIEQGVRENTAAVNHTVEQYYKDFPEAADQVPERFWTKNIPARNRHAYTPAYTPEEQGLPSFEDELTRVGLLAETRTSVKKAVVIDVDEIDPNDTSLRKSIAENIKSGNPVAIIGSQPTHQLVEAFVDSSLLGAVDSNERMNLIVVGNKGAEWATIDEQNEMHYVELAPQQAASQYLSKAAGVNRFIDFLKDGDKKFKDATVEVVGGSREDTEVVRGLRRYHLDVRPKPDSQHA